MNKYPQYLVTDFSKQRNARILGFKFDYLTITGR